MSYISWEDRFSVGINYIDSQHKNLIKAINSMIDAINEGKTESYFRKLKIALYAYADRHFSYEEKLMAQYHFPGNSKHQKEHRLFLKKFNELYENLQNQAEGDNGAEIQILDFLKDWLYHHIMEVDMAYSDFFIQKGVASKLK